MARPFVPSDATVGVVPGEGRGGRDSTGTEMLLEVDSTALTSTETRLTVRGEEKPFRWEAGPTEMRKREEEEVLLLLSASSSDLESSLVQTFCESSVHLDINTHPSVHMTRRFVIQGVSYLNQERSFTPEEVLRVWDRSGHRRVALAFQEPH